MLAWLICEWRHGSGDVDSWISVDLGERCWEGGWTGIHARVSLCVHVCACVPVCMFLCVHVPTYVCALWLYLCVPVSLCVCAREHGGNGDHGELTSPPMEDAPTKKTVVV